MYERGNKHVCCLDGWLVYETLRPLYPFVPDTKPNYKQQNKCIGQKHFNIIYDQTSLVVYPPPKPRYRHRLKYVCLLMAIYNSCNILNRLGARRLVNEFLTA